MSGEGGTALGPEAEEQAATPGQEDGTMWYYAKGDQPAGPVGEDEMAGLIQSGAVTGATLVWKEGMAIRILKD